MTDRAYPLESNPLLPRLDVVGAGASFLCALHCAAMPVLLTTLPLAGFEFLASHRLEQAFVIAAAVFGFFVIGSGYCRHRLAVVALSYFAGVAALVTGAFFMHDVLAHAALLATGGVLLGLAHALNRRGVRLHGCAQNAFRALVAPAR
jgi:hypothetical protein